MNLISLIVRPRIFFAGQADALGWPWPMVGFYLFAFASYFQSFLVPGYHLPFYLVIYVVAWAPALMVAAGLFVFLVLLWRWPAAKVLGEGEGIDRSTKAVGVALLPPAIFFCAVLLVLAVLNSNDFAVPYRTIIVVTRSIAILWALALVVAGAAVANKFTAGKTALFVLWLVLLVVLCGALVYVFANGS